MMHGRLSVMEDGSRKLRVYCDSCGELFSMDIPKEVAAIMSAAYMMRFGEKAPEDGEVSLDAECKQCQAIHA